MPRFLLYLLIITVANLGYMLVCQPLYRLPLNPYKNIGIRYYYYFHFPDEKIKARRSPKGTQPGNGGSQDAKPGSLFTESIIVITMGNSL